MALYTYKGITKKEQEARTEAQFKTLRPSVKHDDDDPAWLIKQKTEQIRIEMAGRRKEIADKLRQHADARVIWGVEFPVGQPVEVTADAGPPEDSYVEKDRDGQLVKLSPQQWPKLVAKLDAMVEAGVFEKLEDDEKKPRGKGKAAKETEATTGGSAPQG